MVQVDSLESLDMPISQVGLGFLKDKLATTILKFIGRAHKVKKLILPDFRPVSVPFRGTWNF